jgi:hypothetical protein
MVWFDYTLNIVKFYNNKEITGSLQAPGRDFILIKSLLGPCYVLVRSLLVQVKSRHRTEPIETNLSEEGKIFLNFREQFGGF